MATNPFMESDTEDQDLAGPYDDTSDSIDDKNSETIDESSKEITLDLVAHKLLKEKFILTALELHTELLESGCELPRLRDFFSNPGNFETQTVHTQPSSNLHRTSSEQTFDSLDFARYSDDGANQTDERVAVLEFELRKAKETIKGLRANLTEAAETDIPSPMATDGQKTETQQATSKEEPVKPHEKRALNFLVNEYLLKQDFKLTSITFSDECEDQDFEDWDDVGLNMPQPPDLLHLYRDYGSHVAPTLDVRDFGCGEDVVEVEEPEDDQEQEKIQELEEEKERLDAEIIALGDQIASLKEENDSLLGHVATLERDIEALQTPKFSTPVSTPNKQIPRPTAAFDLDPNIDIRTPPIGQSSTNEDNQGSRLTNGRSEDRTEADQAGPDEMEESLQVTVGSEGVRDITLDVTPQEGDSMLQGELKKWDIPNRKMSEAFRRTLISMTQTVVDNRLGSEVSKIAGSGEGVVMMLARCLPHIVPNVLLAKREELIPLILCTVALHPDAKERDKLLHILFNLIKRPDEEQRQMILTGCVTFAEHVGQERVETELLPQCWEQINHKYEERRLLVAEACGTLAPFLPSEIRSSLVLSMLQQMLSDDKSDLVRESVAKSLGLITAYIDDVDKYTQGSELLHMAMCDASERVVGAAQQVFLPALAAWADELDRLHTDLIHGMMTRLEHLIKAAVRVKPMNQLLAGSATSMNPVGGETTVGLDETRFNLYVSTLDAMVPALFAAVLQSAPFAQDENLTCRDVEVSRFPMGSSPLHDIATIIGDHAQLAALVTAYDDTIEQADFPAWETLQWVSEEFVPRLVQLTGNLDVTLTSCIHNLARLFHKLCRTFGRTFTEKKLKPQFQTILKIPEEQIDREILSGRTALTRATVPLYAAGVLAVFHQESDRKQLIKFMQDILTTLSLSHAPLDSIQAAFLELGHTGSLSLRSDAAYHESLLTVLWDGVVHTSALVRASAARMFEMLIKGVQETLVSMRVVPALITLSTDPEMSVRIATVPAFGTIMESITQKETLDRVHMQFQQFLDDPQYREQHTLHVEIIRTFARIGPNAEPKFRDEFVLPRLAIMAGNNNLMINETKRTDIAMQLFEAFTAMSCCFISDDLINQCMLPGLRCLRQDMEHIAPQHQEVVASMIKEYEMKVDSKVPYDSSVPVGASLGNLAAAMSSEDAKTKLLSKLGQLKDKSSVQGTKIASMFHRKK
ncbi:KIAA1468 [Branchiostoma lanceolatum]|uniref:KIAA1468 protein n=1 Tax=Branchiostoma lanceolatum TaxID=7740 RepID=A0A8K0A8R0_BRALA|nr:KIAA1468 [Branchiostoma lanceolatum]